MNWTIERSVARAVFQQISETLAREIRARPRAGERLPSEQELADRFAVNRHTVRHAIDVLVQAGLVERRHGLGTFVLDRPLDYAVSSRTRFTENVTALGRSTDSRLLRKAMIPAPPGVADLLRVPSGSDVVWLETLRIVDGRPFSLISHYLPERLRAILGAYDGGSVHGLIERACGLSLRRSLTLVSAQAPEASDASLLLIPRQTPILRIRSVNVDGAGEPVEHGIARVRADRMQLSIDHTSTPLESP